MKKIFAFLIALLIAINILSFNSIKANAVALPASVLSYLIEACYTLIVGSGTVSQSEFDSMNTSEVFDTTSSFISENQVFPWSFPDLGTNINKFLIENNNLQQQILRGFDFGLWVLDHTDFVTTSDDSILDGYGALCIELVGSSSIYERHYYCDYIVLSDSRFTVDGSSWKQPSFQKDGSLWSTSTYFGSQTFDIRSDYTYKFYGDVRYVDGSSASDKITDLPEIMPSIGTVDVDGTTYDVAGDGTVSIGDTTYTINDDGTITINGDTYYPTYDVTPYDDTAIIDLLGQILNQIQVKEDDKAADIIDTADISVPIEIANSELSSLTLPKTIATVFPFCIPRDFYNGIKLLSQQPKAPRFEVPFEIPEFGLFPGYKKMIVLDFSEYESAFYVVRWVTFALFMFGLCFLTFKIVKGA